MAKKLLTSDQKLITEVENVLASEKTRYVKYSCKVLSSSKNGENCEIIAVLNRDGERLRKISAEKGNGKRYYFGVLRNHPMYAVPTNLLNKLNCRKA